MHIFSRIESAQGGMRNAKPFQIIFSSQCRLLFLKCNISLSLHFVSLLSPSSYCYFGVPGGTILFVSTTHYFAIGVVACSFVPSQFNYCFWNVGNGMDYWVENTAGGAIWGR